jgi:hypothetical protein
MRLPQLQLHCSFSALATKLLLIGFALQMAGVFPIQAGARTPQSNGFSLYASPPALRFEAVVVGQSQTLLATLTNNGSTTVTITGISSSNSAFTTSSLSLPVVLQPGQSLNVGVTFTPTTQGWTGQSITFTCAAPNPTFELPVMGAGENSIALAANPSALSFSDIVIGKTATLPVVLTNTKSWNVPVSTVLSRTPEFTISGPALPLTLGPGQSITLNVTFTPPTSGTWGGSVAIFPGLVIPLTGTGAAAAGQLVLAPAPLNFGDVTIGSTATQSLTLSASGASVTVSSAASGSSQFVLEGASYPFTIAAGASQSFNVVFTPTASGQQAGSLSFISNASDSNAVESLSGIGEQPSYSVGLNWNSSEDVVGYNIYRSTSANGSYAKLNPSPNPTTAYTDSTVASGQTYYYAATSVNSAGVESSRSTPAEAVVP